MAIYSNRINVIASSRSIPSLRLMITNTQNVSTPAGLQVLATVPLTFGNYSVDFDKIAFYYNGNPVYSWVESVSNGSMNVWLKMPVSIPANTSITINAMPNIKTVFDNNYWGCAPTLTNQYGQYDNGANVFNFYDNFAGTSLNTNKWINYNSPTITVNNGLTLNSGKSGTWEGIYTNSTFNPQTNINDFYAYFTGSSGTSSGITQSIGWQLGSTSPPSYTLGDLTTTNYQLWNYNGVSTNGVSISGGSTSSYQVWSLWATSSASYLSLNYSTPVSNTGAFKASTSLHAGIASSTTNYQIKVQWFRLRTYLLNGVMPSVTVSY